MKLGTDEDCPSLDWVYGQSGIRRRMLWLDEPLIRCEIQEQARIKVITGGPNIYNGVPGFPTWRPPHWAWPTMSRAGSCPMISTGPPAPPGPAPTGPGPGRAIPWACRAAGEAIRSAQIDAGGLTVAFAPLADGSDFTAAYCEIPYTEVGALRGRHDLTVTMHDTFLSSGTLSKDADLDFLKNTVPLPRELPRRGSWREAAPLIENADLRQDGNSAVLTVTLADGPIHGRNFGDGYYRFTAETGYTGIADTGPYLRVILNATDELFAGN